MFSTQATAIWEIFFWSQGSNQLHAVPYGHSASFNFLHYILSYQKNKPKRNEQKNYLQVARCFPSENEKQNIFRKSCSLQVKSGTLTKHDDFLQC